jgi:16S rRNA (uracil1498-N3)-methyltransferase
VNLILLDPADLGRPLRPDDPRAIHLLSVLRRKEGDQFDAGIVNGPIGKGTLVSSGQEGIIFTFCAVAEPAAADPVHLLLALPRPQTARKILTEAAALGVASLRFFRSEKGEASYASSSLWTTPEWARHLRDGAAQAFDTRIPEVFHALTLEEAVASLPRESSKVALDNYEAKHRLVPAARLAPLILAFGPERGWSAQERTLLRAAGFELHHLGPRVLRTETAVVAALAVVKAVA